MKQPAADPPEKTSTWKDTPRNADLYLFLALFLGFAGTHNFYIGKLWTGIIQLVGTVLSFIFIPLWPGPVLLWVIGDMLFVRRDRFDHPMARSNFTAFLALLFALLMIVYIIYTCRTAIEYFQFKSMLESIRHS